MNDHRFKTPTAWLLIIFALLLPLVSACSSKEKKARKAIEEKIQSAGLGVREMTVDFFHPADKMPDKAYIAVTVTYNFANGDGNFQKEYLGYIVKQDGQNWAVERSTRYTKDKNVAESALAGER